MYFDFEDYRPDVHPVGRAISWREGVLISIIVHLAGIIALLLLPDLVPTDPHVRETEVLAAAPTPAPEEQPRFVFVQPRVDTPSPRPPARAELSDENRVARAPERAPEPRNPLPLSRGNSPERVESVREGVADTPAPEALEAVDALETDQPAPSETLASLDGSAVRLPERAGASPRLPGGSLGDALRDLQRYVDDEQFHNPQGGGGSFGPAIQFDTMGVEFGPWIRRFVAQVRRNWEPLIPLAAWSMKGHVVVTFNVHKNGAITDLTVAKPADLAAFNTAAYGALASSNPTIPLPPEYPANRAFFTVTFFYNESPP
jgi:TonB family protein